MILPGAVEATDVAGSISTDTTWDVAASPYILTGTVSVDAGVTLTIEPGVVIKGAGLWQELIVSGTLLADGEPGAPIVFTSRYDDTAGGDSNGDGAATTPAPGDWIGIEFRNTSVGSVLDHVKIRYAGCGTCYGASQYASIVLDTTDVAFTNGAIVDGTTYGIFGTTSDLTLSNTEVRAHTIGVRLASSTAQIDGNVFQDNASYGIELWTNPDATISGNTFTNNGEAIRYVGDRSAEAVLTGNTFAPDGGVLVGGQLLAAATWPASVPYYLLQGQTEVGAGATLTLEPGVVIKGAGLWQELIVSGTLLADGEPGAPIVFTSRYDDTAGGDSNGDGAATTPAPGDWIGIEFRNTSVGSVLDHVEIRYAGCTHPTCYGGNSGGASLYTAAADLIFTNGSIRHGITYGIYSSGTSLTVSSSTIAGHDTGIALFQSVASIVGNDFSGTVTGIHNYSIGTLASAQGNYWGHSSGPLDDSEDPGGYYNPDGLGVAVSDGVLYSAWLTGPFPSEPATAPGCDEVLLAPPNPLNQGLVFITHGWRPPFSLPPSWHIETATWIESQVAAQDWRVATCTWRGGSDARLDERVPELARFEAMSLGAQVGASIQAAGYEKVHFIAHSAGSWLIQVAIERMRAAGSTATIHATFLDAYTPWDQGTFQSSAGIGPLGKEADHAEHYVDTAPTGYGLATLLYGGKDPTCGRLGEAHNVIVTGVGGGGNQGHDWPNEWYEETTISPYASAHQGWGFQKSQELGDPVNHAQYPRYGVTSIGTVNSLAPCSGLGRVAVKVVQWSEQLILNAVTPGVGASIEEASNVIRFVVGTVAVAAVSPGGADVSSATLDPSWLTTTIDTDASFSVLAFDYAFVSGDGGILSADFQGDRAFVAFQDTSEPGTSTAIVALGDSYPPGSYTVAFRLDAGGNSPTEVEISNVRFEAGVPPSIPALGPIARVLIALLMLTSARFWARS